MMNYAGILKSSFVNGEGCRVVLFVSGCQHRCKGCHNPDLWDQNCGEIFDDTALRNLISILRKPHIDGLTISGGDPMSPYNRDGVFDIVRNVKKLVNKSIWLYTGYELRDIMDSPILNYVDVVVDGKYREECKCEDKLYVGSYNQMIWRKDEKGAWS